MIQLYDYFHQRSRDLHYSLKSAGIDCPTIVINDDGFLPNHIHSPYAYFCGITKEDRQPLFFNQLQIPDFWEIRGNNIEAEVWNYSHRMARIFYAEPKYRRWIKYVDWYDIDGKVRLTDHFNQYGRLFARTYFSSHQKINTKTYFNKHGQEVISENHTTGEVILTWQGKAYFFDNRVAFLAFYFDRLGWSKENILYNSLSTPFFYSYQNQLAGEDILFWQEPIGDTIPGNMTALLNQNESRTQSIIVQDKSTYDKMLSLLPDKAAQKVSYLGYLYPSKRDNQNGKDILILTNTDRVEVLEQLVSALQDFTFHIAAPTEMSPHLMGFERYHNVKLYPNVSPLMIDNLYNSCDIYLDINYGSEVKDAVRKAFEHNHFILGFEETIHNTELVPSSQCFTKENVSDLIGAIISSSSNFKLAAEIQRQKSHEASIEQYKNLFGRR